MADDVLMGADPTPPLAVNDWSPDGRFIVYITNDPQTKSDIWLLPTTGKLHPTPFVATPANEIQARVSPDGRWIAYTSDESGVPEVYVQSFPTPGAKRGVSVGGGAQPQWRGDSRELYYVTLDNMLTAVDLATNATLQVGRPRPLFRVPVLESLTGYPRVYAPTWDGRQPGQGGAAARADLGSRQLARHGAIVSSAKQRRCRARTYAMNMVGV